MNQYKKILYADDDADDRTWVTEACQAVNHFFDIDFVENGQEALAYLSLLKKDAFPSLIVLDLNMPYLDGRQTLQKIKAHEQFHHIPVIIVTTSSSKVDIEVCNRLGAVLYLVKPDHHAGWINVVRAFLPYVS